ncbi:hypothetical protein [Helicobacter kayseriensis]|uniref:hypothetical protein n=1 Tax=Helicobacter kayseriensis TaxID=2905877 RepID=UPI001E608B5A|nr:hypothetical protein [Helicobacter kayseriensis]MCE3047178.1 hypothetical protein [Helicobacter kayseriensis]MCE3048549.1 hypothetical protein [Helicobacter kayseriensis]
MRIRLYLAFLILLNGLLLGMMIDQISISAKEAQGVLSQSQYPYIFARLFLDLFGYNDFALRLPFLFVHLCNIILIFSLSQSYLKHPTDSLLCATVYAFLPGIDITAIFVGKSVFILFFVLMLCYLHLKQYKSLFFILCTLASVIDFSFSVIFLALFLHAFRFKHNKTLIFSLCGFSLNMYFFKLPIGGSPDGHFLDTLGLLALLYSPFLFIYFVYTLYRGIIKKENNLMLYISSTSIAFSLLLSLRQEVDLLSFLPLSAVGLPIAIKDFLHNIRLRLPNFRRTYTRRFYAVLIPLICEVVILFGNKFLFILDPKRHFLSNFYFAKELAYTLKSQQIQELQTYPSLQRQLLFYGINHSSSPTLQESRQGKIKIDYLGKTVKSYELIFQ